MQSLKAFRQSCRKLHLPFREKARRLSSMARNIGWITWYLEEPKQKPRSSQSVRGTHHQIRSSDPRINRDPRIPDPIRSDHSDRIGGLTMARSSLGIVMGVAGSDADKRRYPLMTDNLSRFLGSLEHSRRDFKNRSTECFFFARRRRPCS